MDVYIYQADIYCEDCGKAIRKELNAKGEAPEDPDDEYTYDSDNYPKGAYPDGAGEADSPQHCAGCGTFLENDLTTDGVNYLIERFTNADGKIELPEQYSIYKLCFNSDEIVEES